MDGFIGTVKEFGPFTTPLCIALLYALRWMKQQCDKMEKRAVVAEEDAKQLREQRTVDRAERGDELMEATKALGQFGEAMAEQMREHDRRIGQALEALGDGQGGT